MRRTVVVVDIQDGCTFRVGSGRTIVLSGVPPCDPLSFGAKRARQYLLELLLHRHVQMEEVMTDAKGQVIAQVWADGEDINQAVLAYQRRLDRPPEPPVPATIPKIEIPVDDVFKDSESGGADKMSGDKIPNRDDSGHVTGGDASPSPDTDQQ
jgi:hypothetical protein